MAISSSVIVRDADILGGEPVFAGTRVPFQALLDYLEAGDTLDRFLDHFPSVTRDMAIAALENAKESSLDRIA
ncbi:MAG TPA: DUF433 domain-containing protein [Bryobacteraceae bacterium]|nr:DUF433 domain-containing protein [Bryobacteraceae bacterium]